MYEVTEWFHGRYSADEEAVVKKIKKIVSRMESPLIKLKSPMEMLKYLYGEIFLPEAKAWDEDKKNNHLVSNTSPPLYVM